MDMGTRFVLYVMLSLLFSIMKGGAAGIVVIWGWFLWQWKKDAELRERHRRYIEEQEKKWKEDRECFRK